MHPKAINDSLLLFIHLCDSSLCLRAFVVLRKIYSLIKECQRTPFEGAGKPEPLRHNLQGFYSRRITGEHRLVYKAEEGVLFIAQCRYHY
jgi:toxin YoeB